MIWNSASIRDLERRSIRTFVKKHREYLKGKVLDFGAGTESTCRKAQPYKELVLGEYIPYEPGDFELAASQYDAILCTQVLQYVPSPMQTIHLFKRILNSGGHLVLTYPTCWDEVESNDFWRFTKAGMERTLLNAQFVILHHERRAEIELNGFKFPLGYGVVALAG